MGEFLSPNNNQVAAVTVVNCGATTSYASTVNIKVVGGPDPDSDDFFFSVKGRPRIEIVWSDNDSVTVVHGRPDRVYRKAVIWRGQAISYQER